MRKLKKLQQVGDTRGMIALMLDPSTSSNRPQVAAALAETGDPAALATLIKMLTDPPDRVTVGSMRVSFAEAIATFRAESAGQALAEAARTDKSRDVRRRCVELLSGFTTDDEILGLLTAAVEDESEDVRRSAAIALARSVDPRGVDAVVTAMREGRDLKVYAVRGRTWLDHLMEQSGPARDAVQQLLDQHEVGQNVRFTLLDRHLPNVVLGLPDRFLLIQEPQHSLAILGVLVWVERTGVKELPYSGLSERDFRWGSLGIRFGPLSYDPMGGIRGEQWKFFVDEVLAGGG